MIITLIKKDSGKDVITKLQNKYNSKEELEKKYLESNNHLLYIDLEDWKFFEKHPEESQLIGKTIITDNLNLNNMVLDILSLLKIGKTSIENLSEKLHKSSEEVLAHISKLESEGIIKLDQDNFINKFNYDEIKIEI